MAAARAALQAGMRAAAPGAPLWRIGEAVERATADRGFQIIPGRPRIVLGEGGWTIRTADRSRSAHAEHTIMVADDGPVVLTA